MATKSGDGTIWAGLAEQLNVSRETHEKLKHYVSLIRSWNRSINLMGPQALNEIWDRHIADSAQLLLHAPPTALRWIDIGSGAGFPGLVLAYLLEKQKQASMILVEPNQKKAAFLREASRECRIAVEIKAERIESILANQVISADIVTARALAPLKKLFDLAGPLIKDGAIGLFLKGQEVETELTASPEYWKIRCDLLPSLTDEAARIVRVRDRFGSEAKN